MAKYCRNCEECLTTSERSYGWKDTCFDCIRETADQEELFNLS